MPNADVARVQRRIAKFTDELAGPPMKTKLRKVGKTLQLDASRAVRRTLSKTPGHTLADGSMSGWHRKRPIQLATRITLRDLNAGNSLMVTPDRTAGLWRVLESGRKGYAKGARRSAGVTREGIVRKRRVKQTVGATEGNRTWSEATLAMSSTARREMGPHVVKAFRKTFGTGGG